MKPGLAQNTMGIWMASSGQQGAVAVDVAATLMAAFAELATQIAKALGVSRATIYRHADVVTARDGS